jgi:hypothetical protein
MKIERPHQLHSDFMNEMINPGRKLGCVYEERTTRDSRSTAWFVTEIPLVPAAKIAWTSFSLLAFPVTKTESTQMRNGMYR